MLTRQLLDALLHRDDDEIARLIEERVASEGFSPTLSEVRQFAILAFAPDERSRASLLAVDALDTVSENLPTADRLGQLIDVARMCADARRPWSEAPIVTPPHTTIEDGTTEALQRAVVERDRLAAERWIAHVLPAGNFGFSFFDHAARITDDGHAALRMAACAWRVASTVPEEYRFGVLRIAAVEWTAGHTWIGSERAESEIDRTTSELAAAAIDAFVRAEASPLAFLEVEAVDSAHLAREQGSSRALQSFAGRATITPVRSNGPTRPARLHHSPHDDYGTALRAFAIAVRRRGSWPEESLAIMCAAAAGVGGDDASLRED